MGSVDYIALPAELLDYVPYGKKREYEVGGIRTHDIYCVGYIALPNVAQWVVLCNRQNICCRVRTLILAQFSTGISDYVAQWGALYNQQMKKNVRRAPNRIARTICEITASET